MDEVAKLKAQVYDINTEIQRLQAAAQQIVNRIAELESAQLPQKPANNKKS